MKLLCPIALACITVGTLATPAHAGLLDSIFGNDGGGSLPFNELSSGLRFDRPVKSEITVIVKKDDRAAVMTVCDLAEQADGGCYAKGADVYLIPFQMDETRLSPGAATRVRLKLNAHGDMIFNRATAKDVGTACKWSGTLAELAKTPVICDGPERSWAGVVEARATRVSVTVALGRPAK